MVLHRNSETNQLGINKDNQKIKENSYQNAFIKLTFAPAANAGDNSPSLKWKIAFIERNFASMTSSPKFDFIPMDHCS